MIDLLDVVIRLFWVLPWLRRTPHPGFDIGAQKYSWFLDTV
jgi:hypothetical protein